MLVQKKSQKKNFILGGSLIVLISVTLFVLLNGSGGPNINNLNNGLVNGGDIITPITVSIDNTFFGKKDVIGLKDRSGQSHTEQSSSTPTNYQITPAPKGAYILNPQVGQKLIMYWDFDDRYVAVKIFRSEKQEEQGELIADISDKNYYQDTDIENGIYYYYTLLAVGANGQESDDAARLTGSPSDIFAPQKPQGVATANIENGTQVKISWIDPKDTDFAYVRIYRSQIEGDLGTVILDIAVEGNSYTDMNVIENVEYFYTITSVDSSGNESEKSLLPLGGNKNPFRPSF